MSDKACIRAWPESAGRTSLGRLSTIPIRYHVFRSAIMRDHLSSRGSSHLIRATLRTRDDGLDLAGRTLARTLEEAG